MADEKAAYSISKMMEGEAGKRLSELLKEPAVRKECVAAIGTICRPPPLGQVVFYCLEKVALGAVSWLALVAGSRLDALILKTPLLGKFFQKLEHLSKAEASKAKLKEDLIAAMKEFRGDEPVPEGGNLEVVTALYQKRAIENLSGEMQDLIDGLRQDIADGFRTIYDGEDEKPALHWREIDGETLKISERLNYRSGAYDFVGRESEVAFLDHFLHDSEQPDEPDAFRWLLINGPGGEGKSRLAFEFAKRIRDQNWHAGRMTIDELGRFDANRWRPRRDTCIIIDYPAQAPAAVHAMLAAMTAKSPDYDWRVRVLLLERNTHDEWFKTLLPQGGESDAILSHAFAFDGKRFDRGWTLPPMNDEAIVSLMTRYFDQSGVEPPPPDRLRDAVRRIDPRPGLAEGENFPRPLFAMAAAEALVADIQADGESDIDDLIDNLDRSEVLRRLIEHDREWRWQKTGSGGDRARLLAHENLLALATFCLGLDKHKLDDLPEAAARALPSSDEVDPRCIDPILLEAMTGSSGRTIAALEPDILGEFFVLSRLLDIRDGTSPRTAQALIDAALAVGADNAAVFVMRCQRDFPAKLQALDWMLSSQPQTAATATLLAVMCADLIADAGAEAEPVLAHLRQICEAFPADITIAKQEIRALDGAINAAFLQGNTAAASGLTARFIAALDNILDMPGLPDEDHAVFDRRRQDFYNADMIQVVDGRDDPAGAPITYQIMEISPLPPADWTPAPMPSGWPLPPLISGDWAYLDDEESDAMLVLLRQQLEASAVFNTDGTDFVAVRRLPLQCFGTSVVLYEAVGVTPDGERGVLTFMMAGGSITVLDGSSSKFHYGCDMWGVSFETTERREQYVRLFCTGLMGDEGRFQIFDNPEIAGFYVPDPVARTELSRQMFPLTEDPQSSGRRGWRFSTPMAYAGYLYHSTLWLKPNGEIEMIDDEPIDQFAQRKERWQSPFRYLGE